MDHACHPRIRRCLAREVDPRDPRGCQLVDLLGLTTPLRLSAEEFAWLDMFDGTRPVADMQVPGAPSALEEPGARDRLALLAHRLQDNLFLEGPAFRAVVDNPVRLPRCIGCYEGDAGRLRRQLTGLFTHAEGPGLPG